VIPTYIGYCAVFKVREEGALTPPSRDRSPRNAGVVPVSQNSTACSRLPRVNEVTAWPGPVDMSRNRSYLTNAAGGAPRSSGDCGPTIRCPQFRGLPRKEVIQPQLPLRLPCYDFTPVTSPTFDGSLPQGVRPPASGVAHSRGVTGGVYKARERIHRGNADPRLLATPPSCRRVSACNPNRDAL
jgi:hypothetical protein